MLIKGEGKCFLAFTLGVLEIYGIQIKGEG